MQFRGTAHRAVFDVGDDDGAVAGAFRGVSLDEAVVHEAMETVVTALRIEA